MSALLGTAAMNLISECPQPNEAVRRQVWTLLGGQYTPGLTSERRGVQRFPYPHLLYLTPVAADLTPLAEPITVVGKNLSERGLGFFYHQALPYRHVIASLETPDGHWLAFLLDITWCRYTKHGWYDSGGRFLHALPSPSNIGQVSPGERRSDVPARQDASFGRGTSA